jgi:hypothetical protein
MNESLTLFLTFYNNENPYIIWNKNNLIFTLIFISIIGIGLDGLYDAFGIQIFI